MFNNPIIPPGLSGDRLIATFVFVPFQTCVGDGKASVLAGSYDTARHSFGALAPDGEPTCDVKLRPDY